MIMQVVGQLIPDVGPDHRSHITHYKGMVVHLLSIGEPL